MGMRVLGMETFRASCNSSSAHTIISPHNPISFSFLIPNTTHKFLKTNFPSICLYSNDPFSQGRSGWFCVQAIKKRKKSNGNLMEVESFNGDDVDEDEDDEGIVLPLESMKKWFQNKPSGFGDGKEYDTSIEDKLAEEIEQSRRAQIANINKLKNNPVNPGSKKEDQSKKAPEVVPSGIRVRLGNLPKKKNVHRDLKLAFKGFPGLIDIIPAVSGTKKTRDPVCKGFAFVYLGSEEAAKRFVEIYSERSIAFGKIQKQVACEISNPGHSPVSQTNKSTPKLKLPILEKNLDKEIDVSLDSWVMTSTDECVNPDDESVSANWEEVEKGIEHLNLSELHDDDNLRPSAEIKTDSVSSKKQQKSKKVKENQILKQKTDDDNLRSSALTKTDSNSISSKKQETHQKVKKDLIVEQKIDDKLRPSAVIKTDSVSSNKQDKSQIVKKNLIVELKTDDGDDYEEEEEQEEEEEEEDVDEEDEEEDDEVVDDDDDDIISETWEKVEEGIEDLSLLEPHDNENLRPRTVAKTNSLSSEQQQKSQKDKKKITVKQKTGKLPKLNIPASARRLKVKDKSALVGALSRYGTPASLASLKEN